MLRRLLFVLFFALPVIVGGAINPPPIHSINTANWHLPIEGPLIVTDTYGLREIHPITGEEDFHAGIDFRGRHREPVYAVADGWITVAETFPRAGNMIEIEHEGGVSTRYAHLHRFEEGIELGMEVKKGQIIGYAGGTGKTTGPHLHFEIRVNDVALDPFPLYGQLICKHGLEHELCLSFVASLENDAMRNDG